jgi:hypothetical protein
VLEGSGFYEFDSALERGEKVEPDQVAVGREVAGGSHPIDSRGDFGQCFVYLGSCQHSALSDQPIRASVVQS